MEENKEVQSEVAFPDHGTELPNEHGIEVVVHDLDENGKVVGWHKELVKKAKN